MLSVLILLFMCWVIVFMQTSRVNSIMMKEGLPGCSSLEKPPWHFFEVIMALTLSQSSGSCLKADWGASWWHQLALLTCSWTCHLITYPCAFPAAPHDHLTSSSCTVVLAHFPPSLKVSAWANFASKYLSKGFYCLSLLSEIYYWVPYAILQSSTSSWHTPFQFLLQSDLGILNSSPEQSSSGFLW